MKGYLVEIEDEVKLADIAEVVIQDLHKQMDGLQVCQLVVSHVYTEAEVQPRISPVDDFVGLELQQPISSDQRPADCRWQQSPWSRRSEWQQDDNALIHSRLDVGLINSRIFLLFD